MLTSKDRGTTRKKPLITLRSNIVSILISFALITGGFILITSTLTAAAFAQEGNTITEGSAATTTEGSTPPGIEPSPQPDQNFSEFSEFGEEEFSPQSEEDLSSFLPSFITEVNGTYMNPNIGFQINLPTGWEGVEMVQETTNVIAAPAGSNPYLSSAPIEQVGMTIMALDQEGFSRLERLSQEAVAAGDVGEGGQAPPVFPPCTYSQPSFVTINGINAEERVGECTGIGESKSYTFATQNNSLIVIGFAANSNIYDQNLPLFEESVRTISISQPADIATSEIYNRYTELFEMEQQRQQQQLSNQTDGSGGM
jgi:hypothetical protein